MSGRLIWAILSTLLEETAITVVVLVGLPELGIHVPVGALIVLMVVWAAMAVIFYRMGSSALRRKPMIGLPALIGGKGKVVVSLSPEGVIKIHGELWKAESTVGTIDVGQEVIVEGQDGIRLIVSGDDASAQ